MKKYADGGTASNDQTEEDLDNISPEARKMMEQKKADIEQEKKQKNMEEERKKTTAFKRGGKVGSASKRADGCATKGKTKGRFV